MQRNLKRESKKRSKKAKKRYTQCSKLKGKKLHEHGQLAKDAVQVTSWQITMTDIRVGTAASHATSRNKQFKSVSTLFFLI